MSFYRTELRTMQIMHKDDNEAFLTMAANLLHNRDAKIEDLEFRLSCAEHELRCAEARENGDYDIG